MDLTKLPQELIFFEKRSLDDFEIDNDLSSDGILYNRIVNIPLTVPLGWDKEKLLLDIFNDAYYLTTIIILDDRFSLHTHAWINFYDLKWNDDLIVSVILGMVEYYIKYTTDLPHHACKAADDLIEDYKRTKAANAGIGIDIFKKCRGPHDLIHRDHFQTINFTNGLLRYNTFTGNVKWGPVSKNFEINDVIRLVRILGKDLQGQRLVLSDIYRDLKLDENSAFCSQELYELMGILEYQLNTTGELLNKKKLLEAYKEEKERQQEYFQAEMDALADSNFESQKKKYEDEINDLNAQLTRMANEKATLEKNNYDLVTREEHHRNEKDRARAEKQKLIDEIATLKLQQQDNEPERAFNATGNECFTKAKMGVLIYTIASLKDGPTPIKARLVSIISAIGGWEPTSVGTEMKKAGFNQSDIDAVAKLFEDAMPNFATEIKKQIPRKPKSKK